MSRCTSGGHAEQTDLSRGQEVAPALISKIKLDIACNDDFVEIAIEAILKAVKYNDGNIGDGNIFVTPLEQCIRIRTEERGCQAI